ncbi:hypothetical protein N7474_005708 [Penicillium riverlandense]|uniref:uncharacterized protein n=1 Tax=Penicillium riverlandense TaxID=1903569 RepID=UPI00254728A4|nr:uncharacterized protein N7474_005708 [Penicillium riverlandense]KAJ5820117.1 hypothetical protein N7474_005708 [Penicillium riverlandense]
MSTRTSSRQAAQKAKEAISSTSEVKETGSKRKGPVQKTPAPKREKKEANETKAPEPATAGEPATEGVKEEAKPAPEAKPTSEEKNLPDGRANGSQTIEAGVRTSEERENVVSSNILEKGIIYFFFRPRVNVEDPHSVGDVARSFFVLRPTPKGAELDPSQGPVDRDARCRLMLLPKKKFPTSAKERDMAFVEKAGQTMQQLHENFIAGEKYQTSTRGERTVEEARPYAEGVYAITSTRRASHLAYILTIPAELGDIQENFGLRNKGSWIVQSKNPKFPGPSFAQLPKEPEYPEPVREKFGDLRWIPLEPEFLDYPNAQLLMIGEAQNELGKAATSEGHKEEHEQEPGQEIEKLEQENENRVESLQGDQTIYQDLGLEAQKYPSLKTTWNSTNP